MFERIKRLLRRPDQEIVIADFIEVARPEEDFLVGPGRFDGEERPVIEMTSPDPLDALDEEVAERLDQIVEHIGKATHEVRAALDLYLANAHDRHPDEKVVWEIIEHVGHLHVRIMASTVPEEDVIGFTQAWVDANTVVVPRYGLDEPIGCTTELAIVN